MSQSFDLETLLNACAKENTPEDLIGDLQQDALEEYYKICLKLKVLGQTPPEINRHGTLIKRSDAVPLKNMSPYVRALDARLFRNDETITELTLPESLEAIPASCFSCCTRLERVTIPASVKEIGKEAFAYCTALEQITLPEGLKALPDGCFCGCERLKSIELPQSVTEIGRETFDGCSALKTITMPGVGRIGEGAFQGCTALRKIALPEGLRIIPGACFHGCTALETIRLPDSVELVEERAFESCYRLCKPLRFGDRLWGIESHAGDDSQIEFEIPDTASFYTMWDHYARLSGNHNVVITGNMRMVRGPDQHVRYRSGKPFDTGFEYHGTLDYYQELSRYVDMPIIPTNTRFSDFRAGFLAANERKKYSIKGAILPEGVVEIPAGAFAELEGFLAIELPSTLKTIRKDAFRNCKDLRCINLHPSMHIEPGAFEGCEHMVWVDDEDLADAGGEPTPEETSMLIRAMHDALMQVKDIELERWLSGWQHELDSLNEEAELCVMKHLVLNLPADFRKGLPGAVGEQYKKLAALFNNRMDIYTQPTTKDQRLVSVVDPMLRDATYLAIRYELRYLCK